MSTLDPAGNSNRETPTPAAQELLRSKDQDIVDKLAEEIMKGIEADIRRAHPGKTDLEITRLLERRKSHTDGYIYCPYIPLYTMDCGPWWPGICRWTWWVTRWDELRIVRWWRTRRFAKRYAVPLNSKMYGKITIKKGGDLMNTPLGPSTGTFQAPSFTPLHPLQGGDAPRTPPTMPPITDAYQAGPCPVCGEFAVGAERRPDGNVFCRNGHAFARGAHAAYLHGLQAAHPHEFAAGHEAVRTAKFVDVTFVVGVMRTDDGRAKFTVTHKDETIMTSTLAAFPTA